MKRAPVYISLFVALLYFSTAAIAQKKITRIVRSTVVDMSRGNNPHIRTEVPATDVEEPKARGAGCSVYFSNYTGFYVNIYVDGYYRGQLSPWGAGTVQVMEGYTAIYCITSGKTREWSDAGNCSGKYTFKLYP